MLIKFLVILIIFVNEYVDDNDFNLIFILDNLVGFCIKLFNVLLILFKFFMYKVYFFLVRKFIFLFFWFGIVKGIISGIFLIIDFVIVKFFGFEIIIL